MLKITISRNGTPEKKYIIEYIFDSVLSIPCKTQYSGTDEAAYTIKVNDHELIVEDDFFSRVTDSGKLYSTENIPEEPAFSKNPFTVEENIPVIYGTPEVRVEEDNGKKTIHCGIDIFASCFFMLTRWEEMASQTRDNKGRFPAWASLAFKNNFLHRPVVNEYIEMLRNMLQYLGVGGLKNTGGFEIIPTHDIDWLKYPYNYKTYISSLIKTWKFFSLTRQFVQRKNYFDTFKWLMDVSENVGLRSRFYFIGLGSGPYDPKNDYKSDQFQHTLESIKKRGHIIGFHPAYNTYNDPAEWQRQKKELETVLNIVLKEGRQHHLRFSVPETWEIWEQNNMDVDSTLSYPENPGFRCGTSMEFPVFNVKKREQLKLKERPLVVMDTTLHSKKYMKKGISQAIETLQYYKEVCKKYNIPFIILFHNSSFTPVEWRGWDVLYGELLKP